MYVHIVFLHEDCNGPEWDYVLRICKTKKLAKDFIKTNPSKVEPLSPFTEDGYQRWSYKIEKKKLFSK
jgi:hypothetical protein